MSVSVAENPTRERPRPAASAPPAVSAPPDPLRTEMAAMRLSFTWFGVRKTLSAEQKAQAAESFGAAGQFLSAGKKLFDTRHPRLRAVAAVRSRATAYFTGMSLPYPEPAIRLIRRDDLDELQTRMTAFAAELIAAATDLDRAFDELRSDAREQLGRLYRADDYPRSLAGEFGMSWEFPSVEPPEYLRRLAPELFAAECRRVSARFDEAAELAERMFYEELHALVSHLTERLAGGADGKPKVFRDSAITNFTEFFARFRRLNVRGSHDLEQLVEEAQRVVSGVAPQQLRDSAALRRDVVSELAQVQASLDGALVDRPRRNLLRR